MKYILILLHQAGVFNYHCMMHGTTKRKKTWHTIFVTVMDMDNRCVIKNRTDEGLTEHTKLILGLLSVWIIDTHGTFPTKSGKCSYKPLAFHFMSLVSHVLYFSVVPNHGNSVINNWITIVCYVLLHM